MAKDSEKLKNLLEALQDFTSGDPLTRKQFNTQLKDVAKFFAESKKEQVAMIGKLNELLNKRLDEINQTQISENDVNKKNLNAEIAKIASLQASLEAVIAKRLSEIKDGKDADVIESAQLAKDLVLEEIEIPTAEDVVNNVPVLGDKIRDALELLQEDDRLDVSAIKGIKEMFTEYDKGVKKLIGSISVPSPTSWTKHESLPCSSGTTVYKLQQAPIHAGKAAIVRLEGQVLTETTHYSISGTAITLTFDPNDGTYLDVVYW